MIALDRLSRIPLGDQIVDQLQTLIRQQQLPAGAKLPSIRQLALQLGISPYTVVNAYDRLVAQGVLESRATAGLFVKRIDTRPDPFDDPLGSEGALDIMWMARRVLQPGDGKLAAGSAYLPSSWVENALEPAFVAKALRLLPPCTTAPPQGALELREQLALKLRGMGIAADTTRILVTQGASQAIDLICRTLLKPGDTVLVEDPGYMLLFDRIRQCGAQLIAIPRHCDGPDIEALSKACHDHRPRLFFVQPLLHNPTGWNASPAALHQILALAGKHDFLIAENDVYGDLHPGQPVRLAQLDGLASRVIYFSSFTKVVNPAWRIGYVTASPMLIETLLREKIRTVLTGALIEERVISELLRSGRFRKHIHMIRSRLAHTRSQSLKRLQATGLTWEDAAEHGIFVWATLPRHVDPDTLIRDAYDQGILLAKGDLYRAISEPSQRLRFNIAHANDVRLEKFLKQALSPR